MGLFNRKYEHQKPGVYTLYEHLDQNRKMEVSAAFPVSIIMECKVKYVT
jgi:hypothetical protein